MTDFLTEVAQLRAKRLMAHRMEAQARYAAAEAEGDVDGAALASAELGEIDRAGVSLDQQYQQEIARRNPPRPQPESDGEFLAKSPEKMTYDDVMKINAKSKYALPPEQEARNIRQGIEELRRRKQSGDIQS